MIIGDIVFIKGDDDKVLYRINEISDNEALLYGIYYRKLIYEKLDNLYYPEKIDIEKAREINESYYNSIIKNKSRTIKQKYVVGKILHVDGDDEYLKKCLDLYNEMGIYAYGICVKEDEISFQIGKYLLEINPDVVVITGHDLYNGKGIKDLKNYINTKNFMKACDEIRRVKQNACIIIAGACQSNFEALIASGADFASSPKRINVHTFDPAIIAIKAATTSFLKLINKDDIFRYIENGQDAFNGLQTYGKMRLLI